VIVRSVYRDDNIYGEDPSSMIHDLFAGILAAHRSNSH
jgi:hypothetical protein